MIHAYLSDAERAQRAAIKRIEAAALGLTPDWYLNQTLMRLPMGIRVAVIGGGLAGLSAAWYLTRCGVNVTLYEATGRVGGRVRTNRELAPGKHCEDGAELIGENHPLWNIYAATLGLTLEEATDDGRPKKSGPHLVTRTRLEGMTYTADQLRPAKLALDRAYHIIGTEAKDVDQLLPWRAKNANRYDATCVADALDRIFIGLPAGGNPTLAHTLLSFILSNDCCLDVSKQSYLGLLAAVSAARLGNDSVGLLGYWFSKETHRCKGGTDLLAIGLAADAGTLRMRTVVKSVRIRTRLWPPVRITGVEHDAAGQTIATHNEAFHHVILAAPPTVWDAIAFEPAFDFGSRTVRQGPAVKFMSVYGSRFWEPQGLAPTAGWDELGSVWEGTDNQVGHAGPFVLTVFSGGRYVMSADLYQERFRRLYGPLKGPNPGAEPTAQRFVDWSSEPFIRTGYAAPAVGEVTTVVKGFAAPLHRRLHFAGEQVSPGFFGYMEGALQSGARSARDIVRIEAKPVRLID